MRWLTVAAAALLVAGAPVFGQGALDGCKRVAQVEVPTTGREVALPVPRGADAADLRVVILGIFECSYNGRSYDALGPVGEEGEQPLGYVRWTPEMRVIERNRAAHLYVLALPDGPAPEAVTAWVDVDRLVTELIVTPTQVRESLSGDVRMELWRAPRASDSLALMGGLVAVLGALVIAVVITQRRSAHGMADVEAALRRVEGKCATAMRTAREREWDSADLQDHLAKLRDGARELAAQVGVFRRTVRGVDRERLERDIARTRRQLEEADRDDLRVEAQSVLEARERLRELVADAAAAEQRYLLRLSRIEATIEATTLWLTGQEGRLADRGADRQAIEALETELAATDATIAELKALEDPTGPQPGE